MPDGRKNNRGHVGKAGRKPKADEIKKITMMDSVADPKEAWSKLWDLCKDGDVQALKTWIDHRFGKAKETKEVSVDEPIDVKLITWIKSDADQ